MVSTTSDMLEFIQALFNGKLVTPKQLELMKPETGNFGLGMFKFDFSGHISFGHTGNIDGIFAEICYFPKEKVAVAYFSNGGIYPRNEVLTGVMSIYFNMPYTIPTFKVMRLDTARLMHYTGTYISKDTQLKITITADDGILSIAVPGQQAFPLQPLSNNTFESKMLGATFAFGTAKGMFTITQGNKTFNYSLER
ncbi:serine hydrolase domain-containing protein [Mucilaginibacter sp. SMC90]|uniref:serine hydrolase n=1 Tax=Mucilaginibacter sp. SMC90 TaxID=2929803 RepID=UPI00211117D0|nr:serine hydrolase domain-containing protein [Mucilaginibacter sp. SMC90]